MLMRCLKTSLNILVSYNVSQNLGYCTKVASALRRKKKKSSLKHARPFIDVKVVRTIGGNGGDGCISFLSVYAKENAGPDGGDGGNGGHVIFQASPSVRDLIHVTPVLKGDNGEKGFNKDCFGKNASHTMVPVPIGTIIRNKEEELVADLNKEGLMFIAARGGAGGRGNHFFTTDLVQAPKIAEYGGEGESFQYILEVSSIAHFGLLGFPNAGKSTLLQAISRAKPKVAAYPFTTLQPHVGIIEYEDYEQIAVADLPGIIEGSHKNRGLGIQFLRHAKRCTALLMLIDIALPEPWNYLEKIRYELQNFDEDMFKKPQIVVANKIDLKNAEENLQVLTKKYPDDLVIPISAKHGTNLSRLLTELKIIYDKQAKNKTDGDENL